MREFSPETNRFQTESELINNKIKLLSSETETFDDSLEFKKEIFDISEVIPEDIKSFFNEIRCQEVQEALSGEKLTHPNDYDHKLIEIKKQTADLVNKITEGAFFDKNKFQHVVYGNHGTKGNKTRLTNVASAVFNEGIDSPKIKMLTNASHNSLAEIARAYFNNNFFELNPGISQYVWVNAGSTVFFLPQNPVVIFDPKSKRFCKFCRDVTHNPPTPLSELNKNIFDYSEALSSAHSDPANGVAITLVDPRDPWQDVRWEDAAEWIVDLPNSSVKHITEISK